MLTRLEVDGFKNLVDFSVEFGPFTCMAGPNGAGKSNVFDAIHLLSLLADNTLTEAALSIRGTGDVKSGDIRDLFCSDGSGRVDEFRIAAEMIVKPVVTDDFGLLARGDIGVWRVTGSRPTSASKHGTAHNCWHNEHLCDTNNPRCSQRNAAMALPCPRTVGYATTRPFSLRPTHFGQWSPHTGDPFSASEQC